MLECMLNYNKNCDKMMFALSSSDAFKYRLMKTINKLKRDGWQPDNLRLIISEQYETDDIFYRFAADGDFIRSKNDRYIEIAQRSAKGKELFKSYLQFEKKTASPKEWITFLVSMFSTPTAFDFLLSNQEICSDALKDVLDQFDESRQPDFNLISALVSLASTLIFNLSSADIE